MLREGREDVEKERKVKKMVRNKKAECGNGKFKGVKGRKRRSR